jgi:hypothetical protein
MVLSTTMAGATAPPAQDRVFETWVVHMTGESSATQGRVWLRETPCQQGVFFMLKAPSVMVDANHAVIKIGDEALVTIPAAKLAFGIVLSEWPTDGFGPESPFFVGWGTSVEPVAVYAALRTGELSIEVYDAYGAVLLSGAAR